MSNLSNNESLANKYRPTKWQELVSQSAIATILQNQINNKSYKHLYILTGPAGTGKTTIARLLAKQINNLDSDDAYIEIDGASNNSVENCRHIVDQAKQKSLITDYKIFIIDEFHMITTGGQNALLKTFEDCPPSTIFILATTDAQKILPTIMSRGQQFKLAKIPTQQIFERLKYVCDNEKATTMPDLSYTDEALYYIAKAAEGGMRTALSMLDTCISLNHKIDTQSAINALGLNPIQINSDLLYNIYNVLYNEDESKKLKGQQLVIKIIEDLYNKGVDIKLFLDQFYKFVFDCAKYKMFNNSFTNTQLPNTKQLIDDLNIYEFKKLQKITYRIDSILERIKYISNPLTEIETGLIKVEV